MRDAPIERKLARAALRTRAGGGWCYGAPVSETSSGSGGPVIQRGMLRLVWSRPAGMPPPPPPRRVDLALAIERHLEGHWGLSDDAFARAFATGTPEPADPAAPRGAPLRAV